MVEWMLEDAVARLRLPLRRAALFQRRRRRPAGPARPVDAERHASHQARRADRARHPSEHGNLRPGLSDPRRHLRARLYPGHRPHRRASGGARLSARRAGASLVCNCGYGHGQTVREVVDVVKRVSGVDFKVVMSPRRAGDPAAIVARADRAKSALGWKPHARQSRRNRAPGARLGAPPAQPPSRRETVTAASPAGDTRWSLLGFTFAAPTG